MRLIIGKQCLKEVLGIDPQRIAVVYCHRGGDDALFQDLVQNRIPTKIVAKEALTDFAGTDAHQGFVAEIKERASLDLKQFLERARSEISLCLVLDSIYDPRNFGALLRAAECFGVDAVLFSKNRGCDLTPIVSKASVGASEIVPLIKVANLVEAVKKLKAADYRVVTGEISERSQNIYEYQFPKKCAIIMGSEGEGVRPLLSKQADDRLYIPMCGRIDSLNVSQAAAVILAAYRSVFQSPF